MNEKAVVRNIFDQFKSPGTEVMNSSCFLKLLRKLSAEIPELKGVEMDHSNAAFNYYASSSGALTFEDFYKWWKSSDRFSIFTGEKANILRKAYRVYCKYSQEGVMSLDQFMHLLDDFNRNGDDKDFDMIDENDDGVLSFSEFCSWLKWF
jgi:Ca2+-binding EF-hand superfamily protein